LSPRFPLQAPLSPHFSSSAFKPSLLFEHAFEPSLSFSSAPLSPRFLFERLWALAFFSSAPLSPRPFFRVCLQALTLFWVRLRALIFLLLFLLG
jgi:hypothetical protein